MTRPAPRSATRGAGVVCAGGAVVDRHLHLLGPARAATSNPARASTSAGGVARNVAENLALLDVPVRLCSRVGADDAGQALLRDLARRGVDVRAVTVAPGESTAQYVAVLDPAGDLVLGVAAMDVLGGITAADVDAAWPAGGGWLLLDCNLGGDVLAAALARARQDATPVAVDAVSTPKVVRLARRVPAAALAGITVLFCNLDESRALLSALGEPAPGEPPPALAARLVAAGARSVVLTRGADGVVIADAAGPRCVAGRAADVIDVTGAGDALVAATLAALLRGDALDDAVRAGVVAASLTVATAATVRADLADALAAALSGVGGSVPPVTTSPAPFDAGAVVVPTPEVARALAAGEAVVALESTIITHGMPYPANLETARGVEAVVREHGAVPATIALVDGEARVGLDDATLRRLASSGRAAKASRRDLPALAAAKASAGTTVAATMYLAHRAGIPVFATGGIGGVHRGAEHTFDVSADLDELGATPVAVICAGAKSILDLPKTLEVLETRGVPVIGMGTDEFPAFFSRTSGLPVDHRVDTPEQLAALLAAHRAFGMPGGVLVVNPLPAADALDGSDIDARVDQALADAERLGVRRKDVTPYLLERINELTGGRSLAANIALIRNNAAVAARTAVALAALRA
ncbi:MAG TPA: pseudouridine-5'-phosphate glycosidase [Kineosporiaceae bacterium]